VVQATHRQTLIAKMISTRFLYDFFN